MQKSFQNIHQLRQIIMEGRKVQKVEVESPGLKSSRGIQAVIMVKMETRDSAILPWLGENSKNNQLKLLGIEYEFYATSCHFKYGQ